MAFHPQYWNRAVNNSSKGYNYYLWNQQNRGGHVAQYLKEDPRHFRSRPNRWSWIPRSD